MNLFEKRGSQMDEFQKDIIDDFWKWILEHQDNETVVEYDTENNLCIWVDFCDLDDFTEQYVADSESALQSVLFNGHVCIEMNDILGGYGFTMEDVWSYRPSSLEQ